MPQEVTTATLRFTSKALSARPVTRGSSGGVQVYNSYGEWLESPYSGGAISRTCQDCHMPRRGAAFVAGTEHGGQRRDAGTIYSHQMRGPGDKEFMREAAKLDLSARIDGNVLTVRATVTNANAGHSLPTDQPGRNILLLVEAKDASGATLALRKGPLLPAWAGDLRDLPGRGFARILEESWTGISPTVAYWNPTIAREDTRLRALATDSSEYEFSSRHGPARVSARLIYRRMFRDVATVKGWQDVDLVMRQAALTASQHR